MKLEINRINANQLSYEDFVHQYLKPEQPLVITYSDIQKLKQLTPFYIRSRFEKETHRNIGWFDSELSPVIEDKFIFTPDIVQKTLARSDISLRPKPVRVWLQLGGHKTFQHYDGNSIHGFNLQILGKKHWVITSPNTPLPTVPFSFLGLVKRDFKVTPDNYDFYSFTTQPGDLLFLPRYWFHEVHCLSQTNININWVWTPSYPDISSKIGKREAELLKIRTILPILNYVSRGKYNDYGGAGKKIIKRYIRDISLFECLFRLMEEFYRIPHMLWLIQDIWHGVREFSEGNFRK
ncbi:cupin-like domain-containing protein [Anabaena sphaerica FACHB-251]|uniref:Cupin-like domain-containing protein n=1 Tax=Anabaena sphaerica FACHB-251 TaxID=2692883 RepID=A0A926WL24_9NOST|nr:cupin-like domain-containing protein [Anabaena sphaerica]MBD2295153.1 cupin-like domain-containing protein [Anabaena sphaerica FACHB-251]